MQQTFFGTEDRPRFDTIIGFSVGETNGKKAETYVPVAMIACITCFYLVQLAWLPIVAEARRDGRLK